MQGPRAVPLRAPRFQDARALASCAGGAAARRAGGGDLRRAQGPLRFAAHRAGAAEARALYEQEARGSLDGAAGPRGSATATLAAHNGLFPPGAHRPNLLARDFTAQVPDRAWVADTTYLPVLGGFIFLVVILDLFSRKVVGWSVGDQLDADLSGEALRRALARRQPPPGLLFHSDRGSEFAAQSFRDLLDHAGAVQSMSRKGNCWDNAVAESFFSTLEFEMTPGAAWRWAADAEPELFTFIESYYNARRLHSRNDYRSPNETESDWRSGALAA